ncbi:hypothetical protein ACFFLZ_09355 [Photobacterium aphoticum]|uniref:Uncharacterized protein n=1 Tax=Photobacterium aphoticum TaxID=754436 RepID=A0A0J1JAX0_9GAMM|nr:hypothetical protein [Photobacterium aphoticum]KLU98671.1 hypothetical protein ABT58_21585 [Photobacterium aphoticum]PSU54669.1 hypothetical protein C9I90_19395 [Photobacterium aphoticum]GHA67368.1 hypothetical protein GCM10007086_45970 [Photobacterium aphoticum]
MTILFFFQNAQASTKQTKTPVIDAKHHSPLHVEGNDTARYVHIDGTHLSLFGANALLITLYK